MSVRPIDIAKHLKVSRQAINAFIHQGMPIDSIEGAAAWYNARRAARGADSGTPVGEETEDKNFADIVERHRGLKALAYRQYMEDLEARSTNQNKSYATYDKLVKTLVSLEREAHARDIAAKKFIETQVAVSIFGKILLTVRNELSQMGTRLAPKANPDHPATAMKAIDEEIQRILTRLSSAADDAQSNLTEDLVQEEQPIEIENNTEADEDEQSE